MTVEPVVVIAETDSKNACAKSSFSEDSQSGSAPTTEKTAHSTLTSRKPNFFENGGGPERVARKVPAERPPIMNAVTAKTCQSGWP